MRRSRPASRALCMPQTCLTPQSLASGNARSVGIRPRRRIFYDSWLANHSYTWCGWSALTAKAVLARARSMCLNLLPPQRALLPPHRWRPRQRLVGWPHTSCPLATDHTRIQPGKKSERKAKGGSWRIVGFGPVDWRGSVCAPVPLVSQPVSSRLS
jgi:hypothetical protein